MMTEWENGETTTYGPFTDDKILMLDHPLNKLVQIKVESKGRDSFAWHPRSFRIGLSIAEKQKDGSWQPNSGLAEYDPYFRIGINGQLE